MGSGRGEDAWMAKDKDKKIKERSRAGRRMCWEQESKSQQQLLHLLGGRMGPGKGEDAWTGRRRYEEQAGG